jgi:O-succinylbenzoic acid--CoA ligase
MTPAAGHWIDFNGSRYPVDKESLRTVDTSGLSSNQRRSLSFIQEWLGGKDEFIINTSGSTGKPKSIIVTSAMMSASANKTIAALALKPGNTALVCLDTNYIAGMMMLVRSLIGKMNMIIVEPSADPFSSIHGKDPIDFAALVPYQVKVMIETSTQTKLNLIRKIIIGGAPITQDLNMKLQPLQSDIYATFGMTETISHIALQKLNGVNKQESFKTIEGVTVTRDSRDCLIINTDYLPGTIITNDVVEILSAREFKWLGRWDNVINSGGVKIIPESIESTISSWMLTNEVDNRFFIASLPHPELGQQVVLVLEGSPKSPSELIRHLSTRLSKYQIPKQVLCCSSFTETKTGKVDRVATLKVALPCPNP